MDTARVALLRHVLASTPWVDRSRDFAHALRRSTRNDHGLLLVGTPDDEPWHFAAHLDDEARFAGIPQLAPVLVRHHVPVEAPPHLSIGVERLTDATRGETVFVVAQHDAGEVLLDRVDSARRRGATILSMHAGDGDLQSLAHESLILPSHGLVLPGDRVAGGSFIDAGGPSNSTLLDTDLTSLDVTFDVVEHLVSSAIGETALVEASSTSTTSRGFRDRLGRLLDTISGTSSTAI